MKRNRTFIGLAVMLIMAAGGFRTQAAAQTTAHDAGSHSYTVIANPGENAARQARINWHRDEGLPGGICIFTEAADKEWKHSRTVKAEEELCTAFDSLYSKKADGENFYERVRFIRCCAALNGLKPSTAYMYRIGTEGGNDLGEVRYFRTAPRSGKWSAGIISDFHSYPPLPRRLEAAVAMLDTLKERNGKDFDIILHAGDICAWGGSYSFWKRLYEEPYFHNYMWAGTNGNHDNMDRQAKRLSNDYFRFVNANPLNGYAGEEGVCYHFKYGDALFIILNNESMRDEEGLEAAQEWVRRTIAENPAGYVIVMEHYQWFFGENGKTSHYGRWKDLFDECGVDLAVGANNHIYARTGAVFAGKETDGKKGTVYVQLPSSDNERGQDLKDWTDNKDLIKFRWSEGGNTVGAILMHADRRRLRLTLYDRYGNAVDEVTVLRKKKK